MTEQLNASLGLLIDGEGFSESQEGLVKIFQSAFTALSDRPWATLDGEAARAASELCALIPLEISAEAGEKPSGAGHFEEIWQPFLTSPHAFRTKTARAKPSSSRLSRCFEGRHRCGKTSLVWEIS